MNVMGETMDGNVRAWQPGQRRVGSLLALIAAAVILVAALVTWFFARDAANVAYWVLVVLLVLVLAFLLAVLLLKPREPGATHAEPHVAVGPAGPAHPAGPEPAPAAAKTITLRCGDCGTVFDVTDTGERPLYHTCPGCGAEGVLRGEAAEPTPPPPPPAPEPIPEPARQEEPPEPAPVPMKPAAPRRLKLRCGGCKEVFVIEDTGERPLRRPCPHCGRMGEIR